MILLALVVLIVSIFAAQWPSKVFAQDEAVATMPPDLPGGASLFERPDEWSRVLRELPADAVVTYAGDDGRFLRVTTADNVVGYVLASACIPDADATGSLAS